jgi:signal peptidase I
MKQLKIIHMVINLIARAYLFFIACLTLWILIPMALFWTPTAVISGSMEPSIMTGDVLTAQKVSEKEVRSGAIKVGMVLLAVDPMKPETLYTHRVIEIKPDKSMITKGDANAAADPFVLPPENVRGVERLRIPFIGLPMQAIYAGDTSRLIFMMATVVLAFFALSTAKPVNEDDSKSADDSESNSTHELPEDLEKEIEDVPEVEENTPATPKSKIRTFGTITGGFAVFLALTLVTLTGTASAAYAGSFKQINNNWTASAAFPIDPKVAKCGGAVYTSVPGTTLTCAVGTVSGRTTSYTLTVQGTGAITQWSVTADWTGVTNWLKSSGSGTGVLPTGDIFVQKGYQFVGDKGQGNNTDPRNHAYVSSTKTAEVFTVLVTTK